MNNDFWSRNHAQRLITLYQSHRLLWDKQDRRYTNQQSRKDAYEDISQSLGVNDVHETKRKIESLLAQYRRERRRFMKPDMAERKTPWWGLQSLNFLKDTVTLRPKETLHCSTDEVEFSALNISNAQMGEVEFPTLDISNIPNADAGVQALEAVMIKREAESENEEIEQNILSLTTPSSSRSTTPCAAVNNGDVTNSSGADLDRRGAKRKQMEEVMSLVKTCYKNDPHRPAPVVGKLTRDEHTVYGETVAIRLRKISNPMRLCVVKNKIDNIIFEAEMEEFRDCV